MTTAPRPGQPVRGSSTGRPLMAALDLFGRRWILRIVWELRDGPLGFRPLQQRCDRMSSSVLQQRLVELQESLLVERDATGAYQLTALGREAGGELRRLMRWSDRWAAELERAAGEQAAAGAKTQSSCTGTRADPLGRSARRRQTP